MKNKKIYYILGTVLCFAGVVFVAYAFSHPEMSFTWKNWVSYTVYALYAIYTVLVFCMPRFNNPSLAVCGILAVQFAAFALIVIYIGTRNTPNESSWYLTSGLILTCAGNLTNLALKKRENKNDIKN